MQGSPLVHIIQKAMEDGSFCISVNEKWLILCSVPPSPSIPQHWVCEQWEGSKASPASPSSTPGWRTQELQEEKREMGKKSEVQELSLGIQELIAFFFLGLHN